MKIRLSEDEVYEIKLPEEIKLRDFQNIILKFNFLAKNFSKFNIEDNDSDDEIVIPNNLNTRKKHDAERWFKLRNNKELTIGLFKTYYTKDNAEFEKFNSDNDLRFDKKTMSCANMTRIREMHRITPQEVGLIKFPSKFERAENLLLEKPNQETPTQVINRQEITEHE